MTKAQLMTKEQYHWEIWNADDGVLGTSFAHSWLEPTDTLIVYDAPDTFDVQLRDSDGNIIASGDDLARSTNSPMTRLRVRGKKIVRDEIWPQAATDSGYQVLLQGGKVGILKKCSSDADHQEWHLDIEFSYHR
jgi:hypothetical protein